MFTRPGATQPYCDVRVTTEVFWARWKKLLAGTEGSAAGAEIVRERSRLRREVRGALVLLSAESLAGLLDEPLRESKGLDILRRQRPRLELAQEPLGVVDPSLRFLL
jgi:hypothetical protein